MLPSIAPMAIFPSESDAFCPWLVDILAKVWRSPFEFSAFLVVAIEMSGVICCDSYHLASTLTPAVVSAFQSPPGLLLISEPSGTS